MHPCSFSQPQKRKGVIIDVDRRSLSADRAPFSLSSPALTRPHHPFPTFLPSTIHCNLLLSLPVNLSLSLSSSFFLPLSNITRLFGCFFFFPPILQVHVLSSFFFSSFIPTLSHCSSVSLRSTYLQQ